MRKALIAIVLLALLGFGLWSLLGGVENTAEERIRQALIGQGMPEQTANCMAERMVDRLSVEQLRQLEQIEVPESRSGEPLTIPDLIDAAMQLDDPEILEVAVGVGAGCAFAGM